MLEQLFRDESALSRHRGSPFAQERERYLQHCAEHGFGARQNRPAFAF